MINLTIDKRRIKTESGRTILEVAQEQGIEIPTLCYNQALEAWGGCRLCTVEITSDTRKRLVTSCNYLVEDGLVVDTQSESVKKIRRMIIKLLLARSPNVKIVKELADKYRIDETPFKKVENEFCILCGLCVRVCKEVAGVEALTFTGKGVERKVATPYFKPSKDCIGCGTCVYVCPSQCISMKDVAETADIYVDAVEKLGYARIIQNWKVRLKFQECRICGNPFAPEFQLETLLRRSKSSEKIIDTCPTCR